MISARTAIVALVVAGGSGVGGCSRTLTVHRHTVENCTVRPDGTAILCGGGAFASLECQVQFFEGCTRLALRYVDGEVAWLYQARGDPKFDSATEVMVASDGTRVWFLETEGPWLSQQWHAYDVQSGALTHLSSTDAERVRAAVGRGAAVRFAGEARRSQGIRQRPSGP